jgi:hypothetical protein
MEAIILALLNLVLDAVGHEKAQSMLSEEAMRRANVEADAVAAARIAVQASSGSG